MAMGDPDTKKKKPLTTDQMRMRSTNSTIAQGPLSAMTAAQKSSAPMRKVSDAVPMPTVMPKSMAIRQGPLQAPDMDAMSSRGATVTPSSGIMKDRAMAIPTAADAANMQRGQARQMAEAKAKEPRSYDSFSEFLKTMGLGK